MNFFGLHISKAAKAPALPPPPQAVPQLVECKVRLVVHITQTQFFYNWDLISPKRVTPVQHAQLNVAVARFCKETIVDAPQQQNAMETSFLVISVTP